MPAITVACARTGLAAIALAALDVRGLASAVARLDRRQRAGVFFAGALLGAHFALFLGGLNATSLASAIALVSLEPLAVVIAAYLAFGLRPTRRESLGLVLATAGALVVGSGAGIGEHRLAGDLMVLGAVAIYGGYVASARGLRDAMPATPYAAAVYGSATLCLLPAVLVLGAPGLGLRTGSAILALALVPTMIGHTLVQRAARHLPPAIVALVSPGETLGGLVLSIVLLGALPTLREAAGAALILAGSAAAIFGRKPT